MIYTLNVLNQLAEEIYRNNYKECKKILDANKNILKSLFGRTYDDTMLDPKAYINELIGDEQSNVDPIVYLGALLIHLSVNT